MQPVKQDVELPNDEIATRRDDAHSKFSKLLEKIKCPQHDKFTVSAIITVSKMALGVTAMKEMTVTMIKSLSSTHECTQSTAREVLFGEKTP